MFVWVLVQIIVFYTSGSKKDFTILDLLAIYGCRALAGFIVIKLLYKLYNYSIKLCSLKTFSIIIYFPSLVIAAGVWTIIGESLIRLYGYGSFNKIFRYLDYFTMTKLLAVLAFSGIYFLVLQWDKAKSEKERALEASALASQAQSMMLRYQINPHFLFNSLNTIRAVILDDKEKARYMITELSEFFRYTLTQNINDAVELSQEIEAISNFLEIQKIRFEEKLNISYDIDPKTEDIKLPLFIIHPLVENAVKYGIQTSKMPLEIIISTYIANQNDLIIKIINSGNLVERKEDEHNGDGTNTGINNIKNRLHLFYGENASINIYEEEDKVVSSIIIKNLIKG